MGELKVVDFRKPLSDRELDPDIQYVHPVRSIAKGQVIKTARNEYNLLLDSKRGKHHCRGLEEHLEKYFDDKLGKRVEPSNYHGVALYAQGVRFCFEKSFYARQIKRHKGKTVRNKTRYVPSYGNKSVPVVNVVFTDGSTGQVTNLDLCTVNGEYIKSYQAISDKEADYFFDCYHKFRAFDEKELLSIRGIDALEILRVNDSIPSFYSIERPKVEKKPPYATPTIATPKEEETQPTTDKVDSGSSVTIHYPEQDKQTTPNLCPALEILDRGLSPTIHYPNKEDHDYQTKVLEEIRDGVHEIIGLLRQGVVPVYVGEPDKADPKKRPPNFPTKPPSGPPITVPNKGETYSLIGNILNGNKVNLLDGRFMKRVLERTFQYLNSYGRKSKTEFRSDSAVHKRVIEDMEKDPVWRELMVEFLQANRDIRPANPDKVVPKDIYNWNKNFHLIDGVIHSRLSDNTSEEE